MVPSCCFGAPAPVLLFADAGVGPRDEEVDVEDAPLEAPGYGCVIFVANLPVVPPEKFDKLLTVVRKIYSQIGAIREGVFRPARRPPLCVRVAPGPAWRSPCTSRLLSPSPAQTACGCLWTRRRSRARATALWSS